VSSRYCGRDFGDREIELIRNLIAEDPQRTRAELSRLACKALAWYKVDGGLKDMSARVAMLRMQSDGLIKLPPPRCKPPSTAIRLTSRSAPEAKIKAPAGVLAPLCLQLVQHKRDSSLWNQYIQRYHYLGQKTPAGSATTLHHLLGKKAARPARL